jgi:hypothetical protein
LDDASEQPTDATQGNVSTATPVVTGGPVPVFATHQRLSWLIHGMSKKGKSTLSATAPKPVLVLDAEGSWRFIPGNIVYWDPLNETPPVYDGMWDICIVHVREWATVHLVYQYLLQWPNLFTTSGPVSVVIDSITEVQRRCKANLKGTEAMKIADWGILLSAMDSTIRGFRDLCLIPQLTVRCIVFVSETRESNTGRLVPYMQGQIATSLPYWVDICGYMYPDYDVDANGQQTRECRRIWISPHQQYEAGERVQGKLGGVLTFYKPPEGTVGIEIDWWMRVVFGLTNTYTQG